MEAGLNSGFWGKHGELFKDTEQFPGQYLLSHSKGAIGTSGKG